MIEELYRNISFGLRAVKDCTVYREDVPQGFRTPCFMVTIYDQNPSKGINGRLKNTVSLDILYFPEKGGADVQQECWGVGQALIRELVVPDFKMKNRNLKIEDNVLHFQFDVGYREYLEDDSRQMQNVSQESEIKE